MSDNPYAASDTRLATQNSERVEVVLASRFKRLVARLIDGFLQGLLYFLIIFFIPSLWEKNFGQLGTVPENADSSALGPFQQFLFIYDFSLLSVVDFLFAVAVAFVIQGYFLAQYGQTIGKMALNIKIVDQESNEKPSLARLFVVREVGMSVVGIMPLLSFIQVLFIFGSTRRCLHDHWSKTKVVNAS
jgi:uncharacterized RDD family membrane protein YckC